MDRSLLGTAILRKHEYYSYAQFISLFNFIWFYFNVCFDPFFIFQWNSWLPCRKVKCFIIILPLKIKNILFHLETINRKDYEKKYCMHILCVIGILSGKNMICKEIHVVQGENTTILILRQNFQQMNKEHKSALQLLHSNITQRLQNKRQPYQGK